MCGGLIRLHRGAPTSLAHFRALPFLDMLTEQMLQ
jgi:hypothetical protein